MQVALAESSERGREREKSEKSRNLAMEPMKMKERNIEKCGKANHPPHGTENGWKIVRKTVKLNLFFYSFILIIIKKSFILIIIINLLRTYIFRVEIV